MAFDFRLLPVSPHRFRPINMELAATVAARGRRQRELSIIIGNYINAVRRLRKAAVVGLCGLVIAFVHFFLSPKNVIC